MCPRCKEKLQVSGQRLICGEHAFQILNGIPRFTNDEYAKAFGFQWKKFPRTQLDSNTQSSISLERVRRAMGIDLFNSLSASTVLEVGSGAGRFTEVLLKQKASVVSTDISRAIEVNAENFSLTIGHYPIQADINNLPFQENCFELVFCLGVLQHTRSPEVSISHLNSMVQPGGWLVIDHYGKSISWYLRTAPLFRFLFKRIDPEKSFYIISSIFAFSQPFFNLSSNRVYRKVLNVLFPVVFFDKEIPDLPDSFKYDWGLLDTYDSLTDFYKHRRTAKQIRLILEKLGLINIWCENQNGTIIARAQKPFLSSTKGK